VLVIIVFLLTVIKCPKIVVSKLIDCAHVSSVMLLHIYLFVCLLSQAITQNK